jgi:hypothetical protein
MSDLHTGQKRKKPQNWGFFSGCGGDFIKYADEFFPFLFGREGSFDPKGAYLSIV